MEALLKELKANNIAISLNESDIKVKYNGSELPPGVISRIRENKEHIIAYLKNIQREAAVAGIGPAELQESYPLSSSQLRLWVLSQFEEGSVAFNIQGTAIFEGTLNYTALESAFRALTERHEILRTVFKQDEQGEIRQFIQSAGETGFHMHFTDLRQEHSKEEVLQQYLQSLAARPFILSTGPLIRIGLYQVEENSWVFTYVMHHIISDSWSMEILIRELLLLYNVNTRGGVNPLSPLRIHYKDYAVWQQKQLAGEAMQKHRSYWLSQFSEGVPVMDISGRERPLVFSYRGGYLRLVLGRLVTGSLLKITQENEGSLFITLLFFVKLLLFQYTKKNRIMTGTSLAGREHEYLEDQIGLYINNLPLITKADENMRWADFYAGVKDTVVKALEHQACPLGVVINEIGYKMDKSRPGLFNILVELHTEVMSRQQASFDGFIVKPYDRQFATSNFDLCFEFKQLKSETDVLITYSTALFSPQEIELMKLRFCKLLGNAADGFSNNRAIAEAGFTIGEGRNSTGHPHPAFATAEKF